MKLGSQPSPAAPKPLIVRMLDPPFYVGLAGPTPRATGMLVSAGGRTVHADLPNHLTDRVRARLGMRQNPLPDPVASPAVEPVGAGLPGTIALRQVAPGRSGAQLPQDAVDHDAMLPPLPTTFPTRRQQWRNA